MKRALALIDGLNLHHALMAQDPKKLRLNLAAFCNMLADQRNCDELKIIYFTSPVRHLGKSVELSQRHYLELLEQSGVQLCLGEFKALKVSCRRCGHSYRVHQEKQTDVAIATDLIWRVFTEQVDEIFLFSADSDFLPAIKAITKLRSASRITVISTVEYLRPLYGNLVRAGARTVRLSQEFVAKYQF
jgi:uncharacterized LabA/DUF88 family protein